MSVLRARRHGVALVVWLGVLAGSVVASAADWPQFRGPRRDNISTETGLLRKWPEGGPRVLWSTDACQGYSAPVTWAGRVFFNDYNADAGEWYVRCLNLADGKEVWRYKDAKRVRPNHGITRSAPAVDGKYVFALDPKCIFHCLDAETGRELWRKDFVDDYAAQIPPWYNGQNPLIEPDRVILGVGGSALLVALDKATGNEIWRTPNPNQWPLSHASVMPATLAGVRQYLWCTLFGPVGVDAADGKLLWHHDRKFNVAVAPSPLAVGDDRVFMTSGYDAGSIMLRVTKAADGTFHTEALFDWTGEQWNSEVHTPILWRDHLFAVGKKKRGLLTCIKPDGQIVWESDGQASFGLGSFLLADGLLYILEGDTGMLRLVELDAAGYRELDHAQVLSGSDVWGPMALTDGKLLLRDMRKLVCVEVGPPAQGGAAAAPTSIPQSLSPSIPSAADAGLGGPALQDVGGAGVSPALFASSEPPPSAGAAVAPTSIPQSLSPSIPSAPIPSASPTTEYHRAAIWSGRGNEPGQFKNDLFALALGPDDRLFALGDRKIVIYDRAGQPATVHELPAPATALAVDSHGGVWVAHPDELVLYGSDWQVQSRRPDATAFHQVTQLATAGDTLLVADGLARRIHRYDAAGKLLNDVGPGPPRPAFIVPNRVLTFTVNAAGDVLVAHSGQHRVQRSTPDGTPRGHFGRFDGQDPAGFTGCCNPIAVAVTPDGLVLTAEKAPPRLKSYTPEGTLRTVFGAGDLDPACDRLPLACDRTGRVYVADTARLSILVYEPVSAAAPTGTTLPASGPASPVSPPTPGKEHP